tara:strand:+ start:168 stop:743 length:576 start_codon:yes stop_codon:yes gene_type:complete
MLYPVGIDPRVYTGLQGFTTQSFVEANVKNGTQFSLTDEIIIPASSTVYRVFKTSVELDTLIKTRLINTNGGMRFTQRVNATFVTGAIIDPIGAPLGTGLLFNLNDRVINLSQAEYRAVTSISAAGYPRDAIRSTQGTGSNREQGIFSSAGIERSLTRDTEYLFGFENFENRELYVMFSTTWYEGPSSVDL